MVSNEVACQQTRELLIKTIAKVEHTDKVTAAQVLEGDPYIGASITYDQLPAVRPTKSLERMVGRLYGRKDVRIRHIEVGQEISTIVVGLAATVMDDKEEVLHPYYIADFRNEALLGSAIRINHTTGELYMQDYKSIDLVRKGVKAESSYNVRRLPVRLAQRLRGVLSRTSPKYITINQ